MVIILAAIARNFWWPKTPGKVGQITEISNWYRTENILHIVLEFQFDHACFQGPEVSEFLWKSEIKSKKKEDRNCLVTSECLCLQHWHS